MTATGHVRDGTTTCIMAKQRVSALTVLNNPCELWCLAAQGGPDKDESPCESSGQGRSVAPVSWWLRSAPVHGEESASVRTNVVFARPPPGGRHEPRATPPVTGRGLWLQWVDGHGACDDAGRSHAEIARD